MTRLVKTIESVLRKGFNKLSERESNRWFRWTVNVLLVAFITWLLVSFSKTQYKNILDYNLILDFRFLALGLVLFGLNLFLFGLAWHLLLNEFYASRLTTNFQLFMNAEVGKILPTPFWYLAKRMIGYGEQGSSKKTIVYASLLEMFLHILVGLTGLGILLINFSKPTTFFYLLLLLPLVLLLLFPDLISFIFPADKGTINKTKLIKIIILYSLTWLIGLLYFQAIIRGCGINIIIPAQRLWIIWIISSLVSYVATLVLGGIGVLKEFSLTMLLRPFIPIPLAILMSAVSRIIFILGDLLWPTITIMILKYLPKRTKSEVEM